jgi:hypothetical protein
MAPRIERCVRIKRMPPNSEVTVKGSRRAAGCATRMRRVMKPPSRVIAVPTE